MNRRRGRPPGDQPPRISRPLRLSEAEIDQLRAAAGEDGWTTWTRDTALARARGALLLDLGEHLEAIRAAAEAEGVGVEEWAASCLLAMADPTDGAARPAPAAPLAS